MDDKDKREILALREYDIDSLRRIIACLRSENGCPWDRVQTHKSIRKDLIEETYEVAEAIDNDDPVLLREELGDLLLQVAFHARIEEEKGSFSLTEVISDLCEKLIRRHGHVFGDVKADDPDAALASWNAAKGVEKKRGGARGDMEAIPPSLPSLMRAKKAAKTALKDGYSFGGADEILRRASDALGELSGAGKADDEETRDRLADVLFDLCTVFAMFDGDPEEKLYKKTAEFIESYTNL